ncbi:MAG TPA: DUF2520 domain-containing protein [Pyrinomonadaceae bacterium]|jgi:predicted short-subunit dehydrogenase-like oxidoreductase (DUF2520 family)|nr:DUF2520 domain-containing protein [Pyrinomonadaceae bacterium]
MPREPQNRSEKKTKRASEATHQAKARKDKTQKATGRKLKEPRAAASAGSLTVPSRQTSVAVIGAGRLGSALALALNQSGYAVVALVARRVARARRAARALSPRPLALDATQLDLLPDSVDLIFITTPDDQIEQVAARLAGASAARRAQGERRRRRSPRVALHASGALVSGALAPLGAQGFSLGSLHPLVSVSDPASVGARNLRGAFYCLEGEARALTAARRIVHALGGRSFSIDARDKSLYHAAAVITSGHTVALFSLAAALLALCGLTDARARQVLLPLLASTLDNLKLHAPDKALTGTFARADLSTVRKHLAALQDAGDVEQGATAVYALLGERSLQMAARRNRFDPAVAAEIALLLRKAFKASRGE